MKPPAIIYPYTQRTSILQFSLLSRNYCPNEYGGAAGPRIFPNSRKPTQRPGSIGNARVRILSLQPGSLGLGVIVPDTCRKARQWRAFAIRCPVSGLPNSYIARPIHRKSPDATANIPVSRRRTAETGFDQHWLVEFAVHLTKFSALGQMGMPTLHCCAGRHRSRWPA